MNLVIKALVKTILAFPMLISPIVVILYYLLGAYVVAGFFHCMDGRGFTDAEFLICLKLQIKEGWALIPISLMSSGFGYLVMRYL